MKLERYVKLRLLNILKIIINNFLIILNLLKMKNINGKGLNHHINLSQKMKILERIHI